MAARASASAEQLDQLAVGRREFEIPKLLAANPLHLLADQRCRSAGNLASVEMKPDRSLRIRMLRHEDLVADHGFDAELFAQLTLQAIVVALAGLAFAARK